MKIVRLATVLALISFSLALRGQEQQQELNDSTEKPVLTANSLFNVLMDKENVQTKLDDVERMIREGADVNATIKHNSLEYTPLYAAVLSSDVALVKLLLEYGANQTINRPVMGKDTATALHTAIRRNMPAMVTELLKAGADPELTVFSTISNKQVTALELAQELGFNDIAEIIRSYSRE